MRNVIFIPGFLSMNKKNILMRYMLKKNFRIINFPYDNSGKIKIEILAKRLERFIDKILLEKDEKIDLVAFSMGGLVALYYCKFINNKKIGRLITIFTPFKGTSWAERIFLDRKGVKEMQPGSNFLKMLNKRKLRGIKQKSFWSKNDPVVAGESAKYHRSEEVHFFFHPFAPYWPPLIKKIEKELMR